VLLRDGRILAVGAAVPIPEGATRIDATGKWVTPGLFHAHTTLGLREVASVPGTNEAEKSGQVKPSFNVAEALDPATPLIPIARLEGVTTAVTGPSEGLIAGQAVLIDLLGARIESLVSRSPAAMIVNLSESTKEAGGGSRAGVLLALRTLFADAEEFARRKSDFTHNQMQVLSASAADLEALSPVLRGQLPVVAVADRESDIASALRLAREYHLRLVIQGGVEMIFNRAGDQIAYRGISDTTVFEALHVADGADVAVAVVLEEPA
jgi:imidazolonepropionase-like amidohydrolase